MHRCLAYEAGVLQAEGRGGAEGGEGAPNRSLARSAAEGALQSAMAVVLNNGTLCAWGVSEVRQTVKELCGVTQGQGDVVDMFLCAILVLIDPVRATESVADIAIVLYTTALSPLSMAEMRRKPQPSVPCALRRNLDGQSVARTALRTTSPWLALSHITSAGCQTPATSIATRAPDPVWARATEDVSTSMVRSAKQEGQDRPEVLPVRV
eukprot:CAMPEP_0180807324 /NCGR_PEP_ID=MMETSP1038_2-20121128/63180_1 /TAXON_ID=632150 /ORGANISM="Azadinium spinosum, Strain 3D9" /LENGTH=208 /DNA_ID=CAMNT_0022848319 /DNA_START=1172 /DNA_END=1799 /DNA_ORIENTATION=-